MPNTRMGPCGLLHAVLKKHHGRRPREIQPDRSIREAVGVAVVILGPSASVSQAEERAHIRYADVTMSMVKSPVGQVS
jgi:hypothetical protein